MMEMIRSRICPKLSPVKTGFWKLVDINMARFKRTILSKSSPWSLSWKLPQTKSLKNNWESPWFLNPHQYSIPDYRKEIYTWFTGQHCTRHLFLENRCQHLDPPQLENDDNTVYARFYEPWFCTRICSWSRKFINSSLWTYS